MRTRILSSAPLAVISLLVLVGVVFAAERITNGAFESNVDGWSTFAGTITYETTVTHNGSAGSAKVSNTSSASGNSSGGAYQCVDIPTSGVGDYFTAKGWVYVPPDVAANFGYAYIRVRYYQLDNCVTSVGTNIDSNYVTTKGSWQEITNIAAVPAAAESAEVRLYVRKTDDTADPFVYFDDITFYDSSATAVVFSSFGAESGSPFPWAAGLFAGIASLGAVAFLWRTCSPSCIPPENHVQFTRLGHCIDKFELYEGGCHEEGACSHRR